MRVTGTVSFFFMFFIAVIFIVCFFVIASAPLRIVSPSVGVRGRGGGAGELLRSLVRRFRERDGGVEGINLGALL